MELASSAELPANGELSAELAPVLLSGKAVTYQCSGGVFQSCLHCTLPSVTTIWSPVGLD